MLRCEDRSGGNMNPTKQGKWWVCKCGDAYKYEKAAVHCCNPDKMVLTEEERATLRKGD